MAEIGLRPAARCHDGAVTAIADLLIELNDATLALVSDLDGLTDAEAREPSLLPGWSRPKCSSTTWT